ncbi:MAG: epoxyqueuosine reductase QueH [Oscillospiraceae bacterium]|nr:epoxyqueuosine reductase QueH [Oscillospiraceae bacterium]
MSERKRLLLHVCCAPCASHVIELLVHDHDVTLFFYNPNIEPFEEFVKRKEQMQVLLSKMPLAESISLLDCDYDGAIFCDAVEDFRELPEGGARCEICFRLRLEQTAKYAKAHSFDVFGTTLTVSPHKNAQLINRIGDEASNSIGVAYLSSDFKKQGGYQRSVELSELYGLCRQNYCGCEIARNG